MCCRQQARKRGKPLRGLFKCQARRRQQRRRWWARVGRRTTTDASCRLGSGGTFVSAALLQASVREPGGERGAIGKRRRSPVVDHRVRCTRVCAGEKQKKTAALVCDCQCLSSSSRACVGSRVLNTYVHPSRPRRAAPSCAASSRPACSQAHSQSNVPPVTCRKHGEPIPATRHRRTRACGPAAPEKQSAKQKTATSGEHPSPPPPPHPPPPTPALTSTARRHQRGWPRWPRRARPPPPPPPPRPSRRR